jgi:hypothetical protein
MDQVDVDHKRLGRPMDRKPDVDCIADVATDVGPAHEAQLFVFDLGHGSFPVVRLKAVSARTRR